MVRNMPVGPTCTWMTGIVVDQIGPLTYIVQVPGGRRWKRHVDYQRDSYMPVTEPVATSTNSAADFQDDFQFPLQSPLTSDTVTESTETAAVWTSTRNHPYP